MLPSTVMAERRIYLAVPDNSAEGREIMIGVAGWAVGRCEWSFGVVDHRGRRRRTASGAGGADGIIGGISGELAARWQGERRRYAVNTSALADVPGAINVTSDGEAVGRLAADFLLGKGLEHFAYYGPVAGSTRLTGFSEVIREFGGTLSVHEAGDWPPDHEDRATGRWLAGLRRPCGLLAYRDAVAIHVIRKALEAGLGVPRDLAVIGVDNGPLSNVFSPVSITTVDPDYRRLGALAAEALHGAFEGRPTPESPIRVAPKEIIERHSTDFVGTADELAVRTARLIRLLASEGLSFGQIAAKLPAARRTIERRFIAAFGRTPHEALLDVRLDRAKRLLAESTLSLEVIAGQCGFGSAKYFGDAFRRAVGVPPTTYRRRAAG